MSTLNCKGVYFMSFSTYGEYKEKEHKKGEKSKKHTIEEKFSKKSPVTKINLAIDATTKGKIKYMAGQLGVLIDNGTINLNTATFYTPFTVDENKSVCIDYRGPNNLEVKCGQMSSYEKIAKILCEKEKKFYKKKQLEAIYEYLCMLSDWEEIKNIEDFNKKVIQEYRYPKLDTFYNEHERLCNALNYLSAILMVAEPYRFEDQGRQSRALIRRMYTNFKKNPEELLKSVITFDEAKLIVDQELAESKDPYDGCLNVDNDCMSEDGYETTSVCDQSLLEKKEIKMDEDEKMKRKPNASANRFPPGFPPVPLWPCMGN